MPAVMDDALLTRYSRHIMLDELGIEGQEKLMAAKVLLIGAGGLGSAAALYLAAAGVGELAICDDDKVDLTNLQRQILHSTETIGAAKTQSAKSRLRAANPHCNVRAVEARITKDNAAELVAAADVVVDGSDNFATRHLVNRACVEYKKPLMYGAAIKFDGQASVFDSRREESPCYECLFSEDDDTPDMRCALLGVFAPLVGMIGCIQAAEAIKTIAVPQAQNLTGKLLLTDARDMRWREVALPRDPHCKVCGKK